MTRVSNPFTGRTAANRFRGGSCCATNASSSAKDIASFAAATSRRFCARICSSINRAIDRIIDPLKHWAENQRVIRPSYASSILPLLATLLALLFIASPTSAQTTGQTTLDKAGQAVTETAQKAADVASETAQKAADVAQTKFHQDPIFWSYVILSIAAIACLLAFDIARPGSLERAGKRSIPNVPAYVWIACAVMCFLAMTLSQVGALELPLNLKLGDTDPRNVALLTLFGFLGGTLTAIVLARLLSIAEPGAGLTITQRCFVQGSLGALLTFPIVALIGALMSMLHAAMGGNVQQLGHATLQNLSDNPSSVWPWVSVGSAVILAPIFEELLFRGMLQTAILRAFGRPWLAILLTSALFAAMHAIGGINMPWYAIAGIFVLSIGLGVAFERTKRIGVPIIMHVLFNAANVAITLLVSR